jgi:uncharacterized protein (DUF111 family)
MAPNLLAAIPQMMLEAGAFEAFLTPVVMKKGRPGHVLTVICDPTLTQELALRLVRETSTLGVRVREQLRLVAARRMEQLDSTLGRVGVKLKLLDGQVVDAVPELDDVRLLAETAGMPLAEAHRLVSAEVRRHYLERP